MAPVSVGAVYSRLHKGGSFIIGSRRVATKKARRNRASKEKEKIRPRHCPSAEMPLRSVYEYDYDDTRSVGRFVPPRRSVLPRNGVGFACLPRKLIAAHAFPLLTNLNRHESSLSSPSFHHIENFTIEIFYIVIAKLNNDKFYTIILNRFEKIIYHFISIKGRNRNERALRIFRDKIEENFWNGDAQNFHSEKYPRQIPKATRLQARNSLEERRLKFQTGKCRPAKFARPTSGE